MRKVNAYMTGVIVAAVILTACGPSKEKLSEVEVELQELESAKELTEETFGNLIDSSYALELSTMDQAVKDLAALEYDKMKDEKIDEIIPTINELTEKYEKIENELLEIAENEKEQAELEGRYTDIQGYIINKTGLTITGIVLEDEEQGTESENVLGEDVTLSNGETFMGAIFEIYAPTDVWNLIITSSDGKEYIATISGLDENEKFSITMQTASDNGTFSAIAGSYAIEESEEDAAANETSEDTSSNLDSSSEGSSSLEDSGSEASSDASSN
ncbi:MAG: hypothetical protein K6A23_03460 [Butyrivibrio sp.]|nr:hypothetical protein [Butyrivibrio sp.]